MSEKILKDALKKEKINFGTEVTIKKLKNGNLKKVFLAKNCAKTVKEDIKYYAKLSGVNIIELELDNEELGLLCKKSFSVSVLSY